MYKAVIEESGILPHWEINLISQSRREMIRGVCELIDWLEDGGFRIMDKGFSTVIRPTRTLSKRTEASQEPQPSLLEGKDTHGYTGRLRGSYSASQV
jgi:hypothetical protein